MRGRKRWKKIFTGMLAGVTGISALVPQMPLMAATQARMTTEPVVGEISVSPELRYQTLKGWGTSLCWWGNTIGSWGDADYNKNGTPDREEIAELAFSPEYLNLNIVRYNVGGGDKEDTSIKRCEGIVPGWTEDMTGTKDGSGAYNEAAFLAKKTEDMADAGQLWMLEQANEWRKESNDIINEVFSNSPPYYMTKSGSSTGGSDDANNLKEDAYDDFATYLARAAKWINQDLSEKYDTQVTFIEPLNEPDTNYWWNGSTKQEGCIFNTGELQSKAYREMQNALDAEGLSGIKITGTDETDLGTAIRSYNRLDDDVKENMDTIGAHTYSGNDSERRELRRIAQSYDKDLWMSEITRGGGSHSEERHNSMEAVNAQSQSEGIMADLKYMQPTAWIAWLLADSEYECIQTDSNWGLIHAVFEQDGQPVPDYHTNLVNEDGSRKDGVPEEGYWAITKQFYTMMQYSKFLKAGYTMIDVADGNICAAIAPDGSELVIVAQNFGNARSTTLDLGKFTNLDTVVMYRTSGREDCLKMPYNQDVSDSVLDVDLPKNSVTTYVITAKEGESVCDLDSFAKTVDADVVKGAGWVSNTDKFVYTGSWGESGSCDGKYTQSDGAAVTFTFKGERALIYGTKGSECGNVTVSVDGGKAQSVSLLGTGKNTDSLLFDTDSLTDGSHTVTITRESGLLEVNYARIINGNYSLAEVSPCDPVYTVSGAAPVLPEKVTVKVGGSTEERAVAWNTEDADFSGSSKKITLEGNLAGTSQKAAIDVYVVMENAVYFIDCNSPNSADMQYYADLVNQVADQKYEGENTWGYLENYGSHEPGNSDIYESGWYAESKEQAIGYKLPLEAGAYNVTFGFKEWWTDGNWSRSMDIYMQQGSEAEQKLGSANTWNGDNCWSEANFEVTVENASDVSFKVKHDDNTNDGAPVLSFLQIQKKLDLSKLKEVLKKYNALDESKYTQKPQELAALKASAAEGHKLLYLSSATQEAVDAAVADITEKTAALGTAEIILNSETLEKNNYVLYTANCGTPDPYRIPNKESERLGLLQSSVDQKLGEDSVTGYTWGRDADTEFAKAAVYGDGDAVDIGNSFIYMSGDITFDKEKTALGYTFEVPDLSGIDGIEPDTYEVTVAMKQPWEDKNANILFEGRTFATDVYHGKDEWVCKTFTVKVTDGMLNVQVKNPRRADGGDDPVLNYIKVRAVKHMEPEIITYDSVSGVAGAPLYDTEGKLIQAHGGQIQQFTVNGETRWYWIGEDKTYDYRPCGGIHVYSSEDLYNWRDEGVALKTMESMDEFETDEYFKNLYGDLTDEQKKEVFIDIDRNNCVMERPKMLYNDKTGKYVVWFYADGRTPTNDADYGKAKAGIISKLNEEYTGLVTDRDQAVEGEDFVRAFGWSREAPAMFKYKDKYYIINSGCTGWSPNPAEYWVADDPFGPWNPMGDPCTDWGGNTTYDTQSTCVIPVDSEKGYYIYMGDRWNAGDLSESRYVWLPIEFQEENKIALRRYENWKMEDIWGMTEDADITELLQAIAAAEAIEGTQADYTSASWTAYQDTLRGAKHLAENPGKIQSTVDAAAAALNKAVAGLQTLASVLEEVLETYGTPEGSEEDYTAESWTAYQDALQAVRDLRQSDRYIETDVNRVIKALSDAFGSLKEVVTEEPEEAKLLKQALETYGTPEGSGNDYTTESWTAYQNALQAVKDMLQSEHYEKDAVQKAVSDLKEAFQGLVKAEQNPPADKVLVNKITVTAANSQLEQGQSTTVKAEVSPSNAANQKVNWSSSDANVAMVTADGVVTGQGAGTATITAEAADGSGVKGSCQITVTEKAKPPVKDVVTKITLKSDTKKVAAGKKATIKATVSATGNTANKTLNWSSSNKKYATVNAKGVVTTKKAGAGKTVTITAKAVDGSNKSAKIKIKIVKHAVKKITLKCSQKSVKAGRKVTVKANVSTTGKTANKTLSWETSNKKYATVNAKGVVTTKKAGKGKTVKITAKATDGTGKKATIKIRIKK